LPLTLRTFSTSSGHISSHIWEPLDPPKSQEEKLPEQIFGQKYEKPLPLNITPEEEAASKRFRAPNSEHGRKPSLV